MDQLQAEKHIISIIIPCYNSESTIAETIESVLAQTYKDLELIVVDDCSTDNSAKIIETYQRNDDRVFYYRLGQNSRVAVARNYGVDKATGRYIAFLDSDDVWETTKIEKQITLLDKTGESACCTSYMRTDENGIDLNQNIIVPEKITQSIYLKETSIGFSSLVIDKEKVNIPSFVSMRSHEDMLFICNLFDGIDVILGMNEILMKYRVQKESVSSNKLKAAMQFFNVLRNHLHYSYLKSMYYFIHYGVNSFKKRFNLKFTF